MRNPQGRRTGYALIELLAVITVITVILILCGGMIHQLMKLDRVGRDAMDESTDIARLTIEFRTDVHASESEAISGDRCLLTLPEGRTVEYRVQDHEITRTVRQGEKLGHQESYRRPRHTTAGIEKLDGFLVFRIDGEARSQTGSLYRDYRIEAEPGRDRKLSKGGNR